MDNLTKKEKKEKLEKYKRDIIFNIFQSREDLDKWIRLFIGFKLTKDWIDKVTPHVGWMFKNNFT